MKKRLSVAGVPIVFADEYEQVALVVGETVKRTISVVASRWELRAPKSVEVHILTAWEPFVDETVPALARPWVALTKPLWRRRAERTFKLAGGWMLPWRGRLAVGVKPPELLSRAQSELGARLFKTVPDLMEKVRHITCHEFTHACTAHLRLPPWLNEGLAMRAVDHLVGERTVRADTRELAAGDPSILDSRAYRRVKQSDQEALLRLYATGYWVTKRLENKAHEALLELLKKRRPTKQVMQLTTRALGDHEDTTAQTTPRRDK